jgi:hypothetical protein
MAMKERSIPENDADFNREYDRFKLLRKRNRLRTDWSISEVRFADMHRRHGFKTKKLRLTDFRNNLAIVTCVTDISGPTWLYMWKSADRLVGKVTRHHREFFIEDFCKNGQFIDLHTGT